MKQIIYIHEDNKDITISKFPDGQQQVTLNNPQHFNKSSDLLIKSRLTSFQDLELICCTVASLRSKGVKSIHLYIPYVLGGRSDRTFVDGGNNYLKQVICPIINSLNLETVVVLDPHSDILEACINNFQKIDNSDLIRLMIHDLDREFPGDLYSNLVLVSPDAGASKKVFKVAENLAFTGDVITCSKNRDVNGKLTKTVVPIKQGETKDVVIIDDICDGGATFINIAKALDEAGHQGKKYLVVTHGIFSKGTTELGHHFETIYTTNSYKDFTQLELLKIKFINTYGV